MDRSSGARAQCQEREGRETARARLAALAEHRRVCRELEQLAPLTRYYGEGRRVRAIPLVQFLDERWWAA
jgi:hypothetical protein